jgi:hypothetical protein
MTALHDIFFTETGCLNPSLNADIQWVNKHGYISFTDRDKRWQIPICKNDSPTCAWQRVTNIMEACELLDRNNEVIDEITLLVGGTKNQIIHTDIGRQQTVWVQKLPDVSEVNYQSTIGWEANRLRYNAEVASEYGHSTLLIGMGINNPKVLLGIQNNQIQWTSPCKKKCRVVNGKYNEVLDVNRIGPYCHVVECNIGCRFSGDLQHCGVDNCARKSEESQNLKTLIKSIDTLKNVYKNKEHKQLLYASTKMLENVERLDNISRLFVSTKMANSKITIPINSVSYDECIDPRIEEQVKNRRKYTL